MGVQGALAELDRELIIERVNDGLERKRIRREPMHVPFGYKFANKQPVIDREVEPIARWLRQQIIECGLTKACQALNTQYPDLPKVPRTPGGLRHWLECETLYGHLLYGRLKPKKEQRLYRDNHEPLFTEAERREFLSSLRDQGKWRNFKADPNRFPWSGLIVCGCCGASMQVSYKADRPFHYRQVWYCCYNGIRRLCENRKYTPVGKIEDAAIAAFIERAEAIAARAIQQTQAVPIEDERIQSLNEQLAVLESLPNSPHIAMAIEGIRSDLKQIEIEQSIPFVTPESQTERLELLEACTDPDFWYEITPGNRATIYRALVDAVVCDTNGVAEVRLKV